MTLHIATLPKLIAARRSSAIMGMMIIAMLWAGITLKYVDDYREDTKEAQRTNQNFAMVFEENVLRSIGEIDKALLYLRRSVETRSASTDFGTIANTTDVLSEIIVQVAIIDAQGIMRASNVGPQPAPALDLSDREHYKVHVGKDRDDLFISKPVLGRASGRWSVQFTRRFLDNNGQLGGVVVASLDPDHFTRFYDKIDFGLSASIALIGADGVVRSSGGAAGGLTLGQDLSGSDLFDYIEKGTNSTVESAPAPGGPVNLVTLRKVRGHPLWVSVTASRDEIHNGSSTSLRLNAILGALLTVLILWAVERILRIEAKKLEAEAHVAQLATEDPLTGLPNRRVFRSALEEELTSIRLASDNSQQRQCAVMFIDLDRFKVVNDTLGHRVGDLLLQQAALRLKAPLRGSQLLARLGGDEFAVVVPSIASPSEVERLAEEILAAVATQPFEIDGQQIRSSASVGIAYGPQDGTTADEVLMAADLALYAVKAETRGVYKLYHRSMNEEVATRREIETNLRQALEAGQLELHYQPIIDAQRNTIAGFEALARWYDPVKGYISPGLFIPVAEDSRIIIPLGKWALQEACRQAAKWPGRKKVAVNLSPVQFLAPDLLETIENALAESGLEPSRLELEITERLFMHDSENTLSILRRLKKRGVRIAMDDFGTGYSSLSYLRSFPFDKIKIDRSFVSDITNGSEYVAIVQAVVHLARALRTTTTAEGVETAEQARLVTAVGCNEMQGYFFSRAVPGEQVQGLLRAWAKRKPIAA
jgi:diguanylate cyclase (GGDEF)-like protein